MTPYVVYWLLQVMCPFFQPLHVHVMPVMGSLSWPLLLVLSTIPTLFVVNVCILLFGVIEASTDPLHKTAKYRPKTWAESLMHVSWFEGVGTPKSGHEQGAVGSQGSGGM
jgi:hypothetical protein